MNLETIAARLASREPLSVADAAALASRLGELAEQAPAIGKRLLGEARELLLAIASGRANDVVEAVAAARRFVEAAASTTPAVPNPDADQVIDPPATDSGAGTPRSRSYAFTIDERDRDLAADFIAESLEYLAQAEAAMLVLEGAPDDGEAVDTVFRAFHSVKGCSAMLGLTPVETFAHKAESLLSRVRSRELRFDGHVASLSLGSVDGVKSLIEGVRAAVNRTSWTPLAELSAIEDALERTSSSSAADHSVPVPVGPIAVASRAPDPIEPVAIFEEPRATVSEPQPRATEPVHDAAPPRPEPAEATPVAASASPAAASAPPDRATVSRKQEQADAWVRVRTERLDRLVDMVGELVIAQSMVRQDPAVVRGDHQPLSRKIGHAGKIVRELQELAMSLRMVPLRPTFQKMARVVRDTAHKSGKEVELLLAGEDTEIDRNMVDVVSDPLVHMVRNAVDHGIEGPAARLAAGKTRNGSVKLSAFHAGGNVVVQLEDDGAGLDRARLVAKAIARGLIESDAGMSDADVYNLVFEPGFSTRDQVTDLSGRGVGMDVVRRNVQALNGRIEITSTLGKGTTFTLRLPLTLAVTDGMLVRVGSERYIVPTVNIQTSLRPDARQVSTVAGKGELLVIRGELIPLFRLGRLFGISDAVIDPTRALAVIVTSPDGNCALLVDELLGQQQVVAKPLGEGVGRVPGIAGGAVLGDGRVGLLLDAAGLIAMARDEAGRRDTTTN